jgi:hypothetical protein
MRKGIIVILVFITIQLTGFISASEDTCVGPLKTALKKLSLVGEPPAGKVYYMHVGMKKDMRPGSTTPSSNVEIRLWITAKEMIYETAQMSMYKDETDAFTIIHPRRQIVWTNGSKMSYSQSDRLQLGANQEALLDKSTLQLCHTIKIEGKEIQEISLVPDKQIKATAKVEKLLFHYDPKQEKMLRIQTKYAPGSEVMEETVDFYELSFHYKGVVAVSAHEKVFSKGNNNLLSKYKGYKLLDNRRKEN